jgi:hypothetical protein
MFVDYIAGNLLPPVSSRAAMAQIGGGSSVLPGLQAQREGVYFGEARGRL